MDYLLYEVKKYALLLKMQKFHENRLMDLKSKKINKTKIGLRDNRILKKLIAKYTKRIENIESSEFGKSIVNLYEDVFT